MLHGGSNHQLHGGASHVQAPPPPQTIGALTSQNFAMIYMEPVVRQGTPDVIAVSIYLSVSSERALKARSIFL